jgi:hypothetical protein
MYFYGLISLEVVPSQKSIIFHTEDVLINVTVPVYGLIVCVNPAVIVGKLSSPLSQPMKHQDKYRNDGLCILSNCFMILFCYFNILFLYTLT